MKTFLTNVLNVGSSLMSKLLDIPLKTGPWNLTDLKDWPKHGKTVFSCFHCGGGSSMGYKLAGFEVLGGVEIDPKIMAIYRANHNPKHSYLMGVEEFNKIPDQQLPKELFNLDVLDGSPPCSSFSMAGSREEDWGEKKKFSEGQTEQILDDLFFHFINTAKKLNPKIVIAENVKGLIMGNARGYVKEIFKAFKDIGYNSQLFLLNASRMGVPQTRERVFFISTRNDLTLSKLKLEFKEPPISINEAWLGINSLGKDVSSSSMVKYWEYTRPGEPMSKYHPKGSLFGQIKLNPKLPSPTVTSKEYQLWDWRSPNLLSPIQVSRLQTFPDD